MLKKIVTLALLSFSGFAFSANQPASSASSVSSKDIERLEAQVKTLEAHIALLKSRTETHQENSTQKRSQNRPSKPSLVKPSIKTHSAALSVHAPDASYLSQGLYPTALIADGRVISYIAGTPVVSSPYTGDRPAFDGSDYIVNISSINRDIRLMQQRRRFYNAYQALEYPIPNMPIIAISGKSEPVATFNRPYIGPVTNDLTLGSNELDVAAMLNQTVEAFMSVAYDESPPIVGPRVTNSSFSLNLGFVNVGDLNRTPFYFTAGQLYAPYGRYSSAMISSPLTLTLARTKTRPFIFGFKSQENSGPYAAVYGFISETTLNRPDTGGFNLGYAFSGDTFSGDIGAGLIGSLNDSQGMQWNNALPNTTFGGFASPSNGNESVKEIPGLNLHGNVSINRYSLTAEWVGAARAFRPQDLSFNGHGAKPSAFQVEAGVTFKAFEKPASFALGYQQSNQTLALNLPHKRVSGVASISLWKDTVESLELRHDQDFNIYTFANGAAAPGSFNQDTIGTGRSANTLLAQIGVYF